MRSWLIAALTLCMVVFAMTYSLNGIQETPMKNDDARWIAPLKSAPLSELEQGLPDKAFSAWFGEHTKDSEVHYMIEACDGSANTESLKPGSYSCVTVTAIHGAASELVMRFLVTGDDSTQKQYACKFVIGQEGPPQGSMSKRPTRVFRKLSEMMAVMEKQ